MKIQYFNIGNNKKKLFFFKELANDSEKSSTHKTIDKVYFKYCKSYWDLCGYCIPGIMLSVKMLIFFAEKL